MPGIGGEKTEFLATESQIDEFILELEDVDFFSLDNVFDRSTSHEQETFLAVTVGAQTRLYKSGT